MIRGKLNLVMDGQWGSTGKGKIAGYLALKDLPQFAVCNFMTNAGHWFRSIKFGDFLVQQIPIAAVNPGVELFLASTCAITLDVLFKEVEQFEKAGIPIWNRLHIDRHAVIILPEHGETEHKTTEYIASTMKGCGLALAEKVQRLKHVVMAQDVPELQPYICVTADEIRARLNRGETGIGELAQGFDLSLNHGMRYPYVTSRDITPMQFMNDCGLTHHYLGDVYGVIRTFPIRVGNVLSKDGETLGWSGQQYLDQDELSWEAISAISGKDIEPERTTVTRRIRRVFSFSQLQMQKFNDYCRPSVIALNFCNYFPGISDKTRYFDGMDRELYSLVHNIEKVTGFPVTLFGTGADNDAIIDDRKALAARTMQ